MKLKNFLFGTITTVAVFSGGVFLFSSPASANGSMPPNVATGIETAEATVEGLNGLALTALTVALTPMGAMLTLRFLNMVLSRV
jgi:hypothetical protein